MDGRQDPGGSEENAAAAECEAVCGEDCACHAMGPGVRTKLVVGQIVVVIAIVLVGRAFIKGKEGTAQAGADAFSVAQLMNAGAGDAETTGASSSPAAGPVSATASEGGSAAGEASRAEAIVCGEMIKSLGDLNQVATDSEGVFVFLAGEDAAKARDVVRVIEEAVGKIRSGGTSVNVFTLEGGSREYANVAMQVPPPGVIAMVKGRGSSSVSGDVTEPKLMQAFVAASSGGGCDPASGCGPSGCK